MKPFDWVNEIQDRNERFKMGLLNLPVIWQTVAQERLAIGAVEATSLSLGAHHFTEPIAVAK